jgi:hypothetical protein
VVQIATILEDLLRFIALIDSSGLLHHGLKCAQIYPSVVSAALLEFRENSSGLADCARNLSWLWFQKHGLCRFSLNRSVPQKLDLDRVRILPLLREGF